MKPITKSSGKKYGYMQGILVKSDEFENLVPSFCISLSLILIMLMVAGYARSEAISEGVAARLYNTHPLICI